jgi:hypothetical protein
MELLARMLPDEALQLVISRGHYCSVNPSPLGGREGSDPGPA